MTVDLCVFVEGTYPYVTGGVSAWLHNLITNLSDFTFAVVHIGSKPGPRRPVRYLFPPNVKSFHEVFLGDPTPVRRHSRSRRPAESWQSLRAFHGALVEQRYEQALDAVCPVLAPRTEAREDSDLLFAPEAWDLLVERYSETAPHLSFLDYFWTFRSTHLPLFVLNSTPFPRARAYHTVSTGYAGYAAALAKLRTGTPLLITEHGLYTRERDMEILLSTWIRLSEESGFGLDSHVDVFKAWWRNMFRFMSRFTYRMADSIVSITAGNQPYQLRDGAESSKLHVIPNGIDVAQFQPAPRPPSRDRFTVGFVGRVVPIKDLKTFVQAIKIARETIPDVRALIVGPTDEDRTYFAECQALVALLQLEGTVQFTGRVNVRDYYPEMDVLVLTSLSEGQPLVVLEANCSGIPVVATEVGACRELLEGVTPEDRALGRSGLLTLPASPSETAQAVVRLWKDETLRRELGRAGRERVQRFYRQESVYTAYRALYRHHLQGSPTALAEDSAWRA